MAQPGGGGGDGCCCCCAGCRSKNSIRVTRRDDNHDNHDNHDDDDDDDNDNGGRGRRAFVSGQVRRGCGEICIMATREAATLGARGTLIRGPLITAGALVLLLLLLPLASLNELTLAAMGETRTTQVATINNQINSRTLIKRASIEIKNNERERYIQDWLKESGKIDLIANKSLHDLVYGKPDKLLIYDDTVFSYRDLEDKVRNDKMTIKYQELSRSDPGRKLVVANNETVILFTRRIDKFYYWETLQTSSALVIFFLIVAGNLSILHRLKSCRRRRSNVNYFIVQLAIADLFVGCFNVTLDVFLRYQKAFTYGPIVCKLYKYLSNLFIYSSTYLLVALSIDRWEAVVKPLAFTQNRSRGYYLVAGSWLLALLGAFPVTLNTIIKKEDGLPQCYIDYDLLGWKIYLIYLTTTLLIIPAFIIAVCYAHIVYTIWSKGRLVARQQKQQRLDIYESRARFSLNRRRENATVAAAAAATTPNNDAAALSDGSSASDVTSVAIPGEIVQPTWTDGTQNRQLNSSTTVQKNSATLRPAAKTTSATCANNNLTGFTDDLSQDTEGYYVSTDDYDDEDDDGEDDLHHGEFGDDHLGRHPGKHNCHKNGLEMNKINSGHKNHHRLLNGNERGQVGADGAGKRAPVEVEQEQSCRISLPIRQVTPDDGQTGKQLRRKLSKKNYKEVARRSYLVGQQHGNGVIPKARIKTIKMTLVIVAAFILCWSPFYIINLCVVFGVIKSDNDITQALSTLSQSLAHLNSAVNPIIFWLFSSKRSGSAAASSSDARNMRLPDRREPTIWDKIKRLLCFKHCYCCCFCWTDKPTKLTTDSRMFDSTGTSAIGSSIRLPSSITRKQITN